MERIKPDHLDEMTNIFVTGLGNVMLVNSPLPFTIYLHHMVITASSKDLNENRLFCHVLFDNSHFSMFNHRSTTMIVFASLQGFRSLYVS